MSRFRLTAVVIGGVLLLLLGLALRGFIYQLVVVPLAYVIWLAGIYYSLIPQLLLWSSVLVILFVILLWSFTPVVKFSKRNESKGRIPQGQVEKLAVFLSRAAGSSYYQWEIANRLARLARDLGEFSVERGRLEVRDKAVEKYLDAGLNTSFVDYPRPRNPFQHPARTPLNLDPKAAVDYLESQMEDHHDRRP